LQNLGLYWLKIRQYFLQRTPANIAINDISLKTRLCGLHFRSKQKETKEEENTVLKMSKTEPFVFKAHVTVTDEQAHGCMTAPLNVPCTFGGRSVMKPKRSRESLKQILQMKMAKIV